MIRSRRDRPILTVILLALLLRVGFVIVYGLDSVVVTWGDDHQYQDIALGLVSEHRYENLWFPPGYPLFLSLIYFVVGPSLAVVRLVQAVLGAATCWTTYLVGRQMFGRRVGLLSAFLLAIFPSHIYMSWRLMAETLFTFLVTLGIYQVVRLSRQPRPGRAVLAGASLGAMNLVKSNLMPLGPLLLGWLAISAFRGRRTPRGVALAAAAFVMVSLLTPAANYIASNEQLVPFAGNAGHTLWWSNNPWSGGYFHAPTNEKEAPIIEQFDMTEAFHSASKSQKDSLYRQLAVQWILHNPSVAAKQCILKLTNAFGPFPIAAVFNGDPIARWLYALSWTPMLLLVPLGVALSYGRRRTTTPLYIVLVAYVSMVTLYYGSPRFTLVVLPCLLPLASVAALRAWSAVASLTGWKGKAALSLRLASWAKTSLAVGVTTLAILLGVEVTLRLGGYGAFIIYEPDPHLLWVPRSSQHGRTVVGRRPITMNARGLRYPTDFPAEKYPAESRVFAFGDSVTMGWGVDDDSHFSAVLERQLFEDLPEQTVTVVSAGVNAYPQTLCVRRFTQMLREGEQMDVVILAYSFNLIFEPITQLEGSSRDKFLRKVLLKSYLRRSAIYNFVIEDLLRNAIYYRIRNQLVEGSWEVASQGGNESSSRVDFSSFGESLEVMKRVAEKNQVELIFLLLGSEEQRGSLGYQQRKFLRFAEDADIPVVNMVEKFEPLGHEDLFMDHVHPTAAGHAAIADELLPLVKEALGRARSHSETERNLIAAEGVVR